MKNRKRTPCRICGKPHRQNGKRRKNNHFCSRCQKFHPTKLLRRGNLINPCSAICRMCNKRSHGCKACRRCIMCGCICYPCQSCGKPMAKGHRCSRCAQCRAKCECRNRHAYMYGVDQQTGMLRSATAIQQIGDTFTRCGSRLINRLARPMGIEIEIAEWNMLTRWQPKDWTYETHNDNSVHPSGKEMVLSPMSGDQLIERLNEVGQAFIKYRCIVNESCGLHVHVSGTDFSWWEVKKLLMLWKGIENDVFDSFVNRSRRDNRFCRPIAYSNSTWKLISTNNPDIRLVKAAILNDLYNTSMNEELRRNAKLMDVIKGHKYAQCRYQTLNIHSWLRQGTFEFRLKEGTVDAVEIIKWAMLCGWIVEAANIISFEQARDIWSVKHIQGMALKKFRDLVSTSEFSLKQKPILPDEVINFINERIS